MIEINRKANAIVTLLIIAGVLGSVLIINQQATQSLLEGSGDLRSLQFDYDAAVNSMNLALEASVLLGVKDFLGNGFSLNSSVWVADAPLVPTSAEVKDAFLYHIKHNLETRFEDILIDQTNDSNNFEVDLSGVELILVDEEIEGADGTIYNGYSIDINNISLVVLDPSGYTYYNRSYDYSNIWIIYEELSDYVDANTQSVFDQLNVLTANSQCSNVYCSCNAGGTLHGDVPDTGLDENTVEAIIRAYLDGAMTHMASKGITCNSSDLAFEVINNVTDTFISGSEEEECPSGIDGVTSASPDYLALYAPDEISDPEQPIPYQTTYYDYSPKDNVERTSSANLGSWPVHMDQGLVPEGDSGDSGAGTVTVRVTRLWRIVASLSQIYCEYPQIQMMGANPDLPGGVDDLRAYTKFRINTMAECPLPTGISPTMSFQGLSVVCGECKKAACSDTTPGGECIADNTASPTSDPCAVSETRNCECGGDVPGCALKCSGATCTCTDDPATLDDECAGWSEPACCSECEATHTVGEWLQIDGGSSCPTKPVCRAGTASCNLDCPVGASPLIMKGSSSSGGDTSQTPGGSDGGGVNNAPPFGSG
ncbi:hypothetical protein K9M79_07975 [Candidatus Woesearchaeota archaeon]|nr:hypothetical protein [Candidatus Woesearchaeota archaeon]